MDWVVRDEIFKLAFGTDSDVLLDGSIRKEEPYPWIDQYQVKPKANMSSTLAMFMEVVYLRMELFLDLDLLEIAPLYAQLSVPNSEFRDDSYSNFSIVDKNIC